MRFENMKFDIDFIMVSALLLFPPLTKLFPQRSIEAPEPIYRYNTGRKPHGVTNYIDHHIENLKTCLCLTQTLNVATLANQQFQHGTKHTLGSMT